MRFREIKEASERYRGVIEPNSRQSFGQEITLQKPILAYHATHEALGKVLTNREIKTYDSMGTYLTSNREMATTMYGPNSEAYQIPPGRYLLARRNQDFWELVLNCLPIIERTVGKEAAAHLAKYPLTGDNIKFVRDLRAEAKRDPANHGEVAALKWTQPDKVAKYRALEKSREYYTQVCKSADYCKEYRSVLESAGLQGIIWNNRNWDNSPEKQTIFLVFHQEDLHPIQEDAQPAPGIDLTTFDTFQASLKTLPREKLDALKALVNKVQTDSYKPHPGYIELYHGAPREAAEDIKKNGFKLTTGQRGGFGIGARGAKQWHLSDRR